MVATRRRVLQGVVLLLTLVIGGGAGARLTSVQAQGGMIACPAPSTPAAAPAPSVASPVAMGDATFPDGGGELTVFAAVSLTDAFEQIKTDLEAAHPGLTITYNFGGSPALVTQLNDGAQADVFASANMAQMQVATDNGSVGGEPVPFVRNWLAIVTPADNPAGITTPADLGTPDLLVVLAQAEVPVGRYAREAICRMGQDTPTYGEDFVQRVAANIVSEEEDVRDVLAKVALGEADAGIVYVSDAFIGGDEVQLVDIPDGVNSVATYPIAAVAGGDAVLAEAFIGYLLSPEGQSTLAAFGFETVS